MAKAQSKQKKRRIIIREALILQDLETKLKEGDIIQNRKREEVVIAISSNTNEVLTAYRERCNIREKLYAHKEADITSGIILIPYPGIIKIEKSNRDYKRCVRSLKRAEL